MMKNETSSIRFCDVKICTSCKSNNVVKNGFTAHKKQQFICKSCKNKFIDYYTYKAYNKWINKRIIQFTIEGLGIQSTARILKIPAPQSLPTLRYKKKQKAHFNYVFIAFL
jgi:insertion element IS1 protein InsB